MSRAPAAMSQTSETAAAARTGADANAGYFEQSSLPITSLLFLAPLIIVYEVGTHWYAFDPVSHVEQRIIAFNKLQSFFTMFGATSPYMPPAAVVCILLACHIIRNDAWTVRSSVLLGMLMESAMYAIPLVTLGYLFQHYLLIHPRVDNWRGLLVLSIGAGIYEEIVFRFIAFHLLHILLIDFLQVPKKKALPLMVMISAVAFSMYHYRLPWLHYYGSELFDWQSFVFRTLAGIYFGLIFLWRGFGLTAGAHASYDIIIVLLRLAAQG